MTEPNVLLAAVLDEAGMSQQGLASRVNRTGQARGLRRKLTYDHTSVNRWLRGQRPRDPVPELICEVLSARIGRTLTIEDIGLGSSGDPGPQSLTQFLDRTVADWWTDNQRHPQEQPGVDMLSNRRAIVPVWEWAEPLGDLDISHAGEISVGMSDVDRISDARQHYEQMYRYSGGLTTQPRLVAYLNNHVAPLLRGSYSDQVGRALYRSVSGLTVLAGNCAYDAEYHGMAQRYYHQALRLAKGAQDQPFGAYVVAVMVNQALAIGEFRQALSFAETALRGTVTPALGADLRVMQAKAYSQIGDRNATYDSMTEAENFAEQIAQQRELPETSYIQPGLVEAQLAEALIGIRDLRRASELGERSLQTDTHPRGRVNRLATMATIAVRSDDVDHAAALAIEMIERGQGMESRRLFDRFRKLRFALAEKDSPSAAEAIDRIDRTLHILP